MSFVLPSLYPIVDADAAAAAGWTVADLTRAFADGGATLIQLRAKRATAREWLQLAEAVLSAARPAGVRVLINDRTDIAAVAGADGVHLGQDDLPPAMAAHLLGRGRVIGWSAHTEALIRQALDEPVDYVGVGPVYATGTKQTDYGDVGLERVRAARRVLDAEALRTGRPRLPMVAIGGITLDRAPAVVAAGADGVSVISDLLSAGDPSARVRQYIARLR